jgi:hypothetical protein
LRGTASGKDQATARAVLRFSEKGREMPDETSAAPGTTEGPADAGDHERDESGEREQGVRTERSEDLSSPRFTVPAEPREEQD